MVDTDAAGNRKLNKKRATGRLDGMVALAMAVGASHEPEQDDTDDFMAAIRNPIIT